MTTENRKAQARKIFEELENTMTNLYCRWQDEKEYEDFEDYKKIIADKLIPYDAKFLSMSKRPFAVKFQLSNATYEIKVSATQYEYTLIGGGENEVH